MKHLFNTERGELELQGKFLAVRRQQFCYKLIIWDAVCHQYIFEGATTCDLELL